MGSISEEEMEFEVSKASKRRSQDSDGFEKVVNPKKTRQSLRQQELNQQAAKRINQPVVKTATQDTSSNSSNTKPKPVKIITSKPKPVEAIASLQVVQAYIKSSSSGIKLNDVSIQSIMSSPNIKKVRIHCNSVDIKEKVIAVLKSHQVNFHSFSEPDNKSTVYVLKGYDVSSEQNEILNDLKEHQIPAIKVTTIVKSSESKRAVHLVHFPKDSITLQTLSYQHKAIFGAKVNWEIQNSKLKKPTQCHRCQRWGHSSLNCGYPARCVKCGEGHATADCVRPKRTEIAEQTSLPPPKCANCNEDHPSNYAGCKHAKEYKKFSTSRQQVKTITKVVSKRPIINYNEDFPPMVSSPTPIIPHSSTKQVTSAWKQTQQHQSESSDLQEQVPPPSPLVSTLSSILSQIINGIDLSIFAPLITSLINFLPKLLSAENKVDKITQLITTIDTAFNGL